MTLLTWQTAQRGDRALLQSFTCTERAHFDRLLRRNVHPRPWELVVQSGIRGLNPATEGQVLYLGLDDEGIGAVCLFAADRPGEFKLMAVAVALRYRRQGGAAADEAITVALEAAGDLAAQQGYPQAYIVGFVHDKNLPSQRMCQRRGFTCDGPVPGLANHQHGPLS